MKTKRLLTSSSLSEAHIIQGKLDSEGIDCFLTNENISSLLPINNSMLLGVQVFVKETDYQKAFEILNKNEDM
jgi:hypothetical protein